MIVYVAGSGIVSSLGIGVSQNYDALLCILIHRNWIRSCKDFQ
jgi:hypothetical protein